jgi:sugar lactone lactonase YvrE
MSPECATASDCEVDVECAEVSCTAGLALAASACGDDDGATDTGTPDTGMPDTGTGDTGTGDTGTGDTGTGDGGDGSVSRCGADGLELPGDAFYPEGIAIGGDGTVYVGSLATGEVVRFPGGTGPAETFVASGGALTNTVGLLYDSARSIIWACTSNLTTFAGAAVVGLNEADGSVAVTHTFPSDPGFCNDMALDADGNLFATDSAAMRIIRVPAADAMTDDSAAVWSEDAMYAVGAGEFGLNGIVVDGSNVYTVIFANGKVFRIPIMGSGMAGTIEEITPDPALMGPDGLKMIVTDTLAVLQNSAGVLSTLDVSGSPSVATEIAAGLDAPSTFAVTSSNEALVVEAQLDDFLGGTDPALPFCVRRIALP